MSIRRAPLPKFAVGSQVRVKKGFTAPNCPDIPMGGWHGKVYQVSGTIYMVHWSNATLEAIHPIHREQWRRNGEDFLVMWLQENVLEADSEKPLCMEQPKHEDSG